MNTKINEFSKKNLCIRERTSCIINSFDLKDEFYLSLQIKSKSSSINSICNDISLMKSEIDYSYRFFMTPQEVLNIRLELINLYKFLDYLMKFINLQKEYSKEHVNSLIKNYIREIKDILTEKTYHIFMVSLYIYLNFSF
ncbi:hypothetical protein [Clostridioides difficile]|uniref:hypothetical protein n=1 Tax=Clostridioides difficile TaxID=1496 RepID=UPI001033E67F|nr:hypothetical protein [Clostridioides difficile]MDB0411704.1 hypothetical protein [Clostridioides difficile]MDB2942835.1 hypothetical protein [Clostridioides difficile]MDB3259604.1 hypothetical protein [Clostridioides difficile]MDB3589069.1 hypothetical protein [Clostridioides difficile]MDB3601331.1 hypothetical protein [Clostridioides difficile]